MVPPLYLAVAVRWEHSVHHAVQLRVRLCVCARVFVVLWEIARENFRKSNGQKRVCEGVCGFFVLVRVLLWSGRSVCGHLAVRLVAVANLPTGVNDKDPGREEEETS